MTLVSTVSVNVSLKDNIYLVLVKQFLIFLLHEPRGVIVIHVAAVPRVVKRSKDPKKVSKETTRTYQGVTLLLTL